MRSRRRSGFTLLEVLVALAILEVGLVGTVGVIVIAHRSLAAAELLHRATQAAAGAADSLLSAGGASAGGSETAWGRLRWSVEPAGLVLVAEDASGATLLDWWIPAPSVPR